MRFYEYFEHEREEYLLEFLELPNGIPDADTFRRVFERLKPNELASCLNAWLGLEREKRCLDLFGGTADHLVPGTAERVNDLVQNALDPAANMLVAAHVSRPASIHARG